MYNVYENVKEGRKEIELLLLRLANKKPGQNMSPLDFMGVTRINNIFVSRVTHAEISTILNTLKAGAPGYDVWFISKWRYFYIHDLGGKMYEHLFGFFKEILYFWRRDIILKKWCTIMVSEE